MAGHREIEATEAITGKGVGTALDHEGAGLEILNEGIENWFKYLEERLIIHPLIEREIHRMILPAADADIIDVSGPREVVVPELVEGARHDAVGRVEGFLDAVAVVLVDVDVEYSLMGPRRCYKG